MIWVQEGAKPLTEQAEVALRGASRALAPQLIRARTLPSPELRLREDLLASLLDVPLAELQGTFSPVYVNETCTVDFATRDRFESHHFCFSVSDAEQERRFQARINDPTKRWKLSPMDLQSRSRWLDYSRAKDEMFAHCDIKQAPWYVVHADEKKRARLNCIAHLLGLIPYRDLTPEAINLPPRQADQGYVRPPMTDQTFVPEVY